MIDLRTVAPGAKVNVVRSLSGSPHVAIAQDFAGMRFVDCTTGELGAAITHPEDVPEVYVYDQWFVHPDGAWSMALCFAERDCSVRLDHASGTARRIDLPPTMGLPSGNAWFDDDGSLTVVTYDKLTWRFDGEAWALAEPSETFTQWTRSLAASLDDAGSYTFFKADPGGGVVYLMSPETKKAGIASLARPEALLVPRSEDLIDVAGYGPSVLTATEAQVFRHRGSGEPKMLYECAPDETIMGIVSHRHEAEEYLVILCAAGPGSRLHILHPSVEPEGA